jgi:hypothetical protein
MKNYTSLRQVTEAYKSGELMWSYTFTFKGFHCWWGGYDLRDGVVECSFDRLRSDPSTDAQYKDFYRLAELPCFVKNYAVDVVLT